MAFGLLGLFLAYGSCLSRTAAAQPAAGGLVSWGAQATPPVPPGTRFKAVAAGQDHTNALILAIEQDGRVVGWGSNDFGQATVPNGLSNVTAIAAGAFHGLALEQDGTVVAWGRNDSGQSAVPFGLSNVIAIAAGYDHSLALKRDGSVVGWGSNDYGQSACPATNRVIAIAAGYGHSLALQEDGKVVAWGDNYYRQSYVPTTLSHVIAIAAGEFHNMALGVDGTVAAWGGDVDADFNYRGQVDVPPGLRDVVAIAAGGYHSLALEQDGTVVAWGDNRLGESSVPAGLSSAIGIAAGFDSSLALVTLGAPIAVLPASQGVGVGQTAEFTASATGLVPTGYQWFFNGTNLLNGATDAVLELTNVQPWQSGAYTVVVTNASAAVTSAPATLTITTPVVVADCTDSGLRSAMSGGGQVVFGCDGTIAVSTITVATDTMLDGTGHEVTLSGGNLNRVFYVPLGVTLILSNLTIADGYSQDGQGGGILNDGTLRVINCTFRGNSTSGTQGLNTGDGGGEADGGAICNSVQGVLSVSGSTFWDNETVGGAGKAGAAGAWMGMGPIDGSPGGSGGPAWGGAIYNAGRASVVNSTFAANSATGGAGGEGGSPGYTVVEGPRGPDMEYGNPGAGGVGGPAVAAVYDTSGLCALTNCTLALNVAAGGAGGLAGGGGAGASPSGAILGCVNGPTLANSVLAANSGPDSLTDGGHNLVSATTNGLVGPLADNGGPTLTMALLSGSPAIDGGDLALAPQTDQRGVPRLYGSACDVGAFEVQTPVWLRALEGAAGKAELLVGGAPGQAFWLQASTNLVDWAGVQTNQLGSGGLMVLETDAGEAWEFYRAELILLTGGCTIEAIASPLGGGWAGGGGRFLQGYGVALVASPAPGWAFTNWTENGAVVSTLPGYAFTAAADRTLRANFAPLCTITVAASPAGDGSASGGGTFLGGTSVTVEAAPNSGYAFVNWAENGWSVSASASYTFTVTTNGLLTANFGPASTVDVSAVPPEGGSVSGGGPFVTGSVVTVIATPASGYVFVSWTENGVPVSTSASYTFTLATNRVLAANFAAPCSVTLIASPPEGGSVSGGGTFLNGSSVTALATTNSGYGFVNWTENGAPVSASPSYTFTASADRTLTANFAPLFVIAVSASPAAGGWVSGTGAYIEGMEITVLAVPQPGYLFVNWTENGLAVSPSARYSFAVTTNRVLTGSFAPAPAVTVNVSPPDGGSVSGGGTFPSGTLVTVAASPNWDYAFANWREDGLPVATSSNYTFALTTNRSLTAEFAPVGPVHVVSECTEAALRSAMAGGGAVTFSCDGTIVLAGTITNASDTRLDGTGRNVTISGNQSVRVFCVNTNTHLTLVNLTIADGASSSGCALLNLGGVVDLTGVSFNQNSASASITNGVRPQAGGGAVFNSSGSVKARNCLFTGNAAWTVQLGDSSALSLAHGGALVNEAGQVNLQACVFVGNRASGANAFLQSLASVGDPGLGGAIDNRGALTLDLCTMAGNSATGGASAGDPQGALGAEGSGGAIFNEGTLTITRTTLCNNTASGGHGGQGWATSDPNNMNGFPGGDGGAARGAAICNLGSVWVGASTFASNVVAGGAGGGGGGGRQYMDIGGNGSGGGSGGSGLGGALFNGGTAAMVNCTIAFNAGNGGPGGAGGSGGSPSVTGSWGAAGGGGGPGVGGIEGQCNLTNCTVAWSVGTGGTGGAGGAGFVWYGQGGSGAQGGDGSASGTSGGAMVNTLMASNAPAGVDTFADPMLGPLADNGGPTWTMALLPGSPAIDAADTASAPPTDQRGFPRPYRGLADLGAYEAMPLYSVIAGISAVGEGFVSGGGTFGSGAAVTLVATPNPGYAFISWTENGAGVSASPSYTFTASADRTVTANFGPLYTLSVGVSPAAGGLVSGGGALAGGASATVQATTNSGYQFVAWTENGAVVSRAPSYSFTLSADRTLVANFASYPFVPPKADYACLFADQTNGVSPQSAGCLSLSIGARGVFSGKLQLAGVNYALSGQFDGSGKAHRTIARSRGRSSLTADLELDLLSGAAQVAGTVSDGRWTAELVGDGAWFDAKTNAAPQRGQYTMLLAGAYGSTNKPAGDGYATLTVSPGGVVSGRLVLADGTALTVSSFLSRLGQWPLYASLYGGQGVLWGWLAFSNASDLGGTVAWIRPALSSSYYPAGFSLAAPVLGTRYVAFGKGTNVLGLAANTNLMLTLEGDGLAAAITNWFTLRTNDVVTPVSGPRLSLSFTPASGVFTGTVANPATPKPISFGGVVLQGRGMGSGFFLYGAGCGEVQLEP
jgi:hypothetical protein